MANIRDLSQFFINTLGAIDEHKLHKLCYFAQGWSLAWTSHPITDADFQAGKYGPVSLDVRTSIDRTSPDRTMAATLICDGDATQLTDTEVKIAKSIAEFYGQLSFTELTALSHGAAWRKARGTLPDNAKCDHILDKKEILKEFVAAQSKGHARPVMPNLEKQVSFDDLLAACDDVERRWHEAFSLLAYR